MDLELLKTFIEVSRTRHFGQAADNLFLTQSAVSSRMRLLEQIVGTPLLSRVRGNIHPTPAGERLLDHAGHIIGAWHRAQMDISLAEELTIPLTIGIAPNLWGADVQAWVKTLHRELPNIALTIEQHAPLILAQRLQQGSVDIALTCEKPSPSSLKISALGAESLVLVSSQADLSLREALAGTYVVVDWGAEVANVHDGLHPEVSGAVVNFSVEHHALQFLLACGASAYFSRSLVRDDLASGRLFEVDGAASIERTTYVAYNPDSARAGVMKRALQCLPASFEGL